MANNEHVAMLKKGVEAWNEWRDENPDIVPDLQRAELNGEILRGANLNKANLDGANLREADLDGAKLVGANLYEANLVWAKLRGAHLNDAALDGADLDGANVDGANLDEANLDAVNLLGAELNGAILRGAYLGYANLNAANLNGADLTQAGLVHTVLGATTLSEVKGLDQCRHEGPSIIDFQTLKNSGPLPLAFLRGVGLPDRLIDHLPSFLNEAIQHYSCFTSYSSKDQAFAERVHADLQNKGVRCWFAPHDLPIGAKTIDALDEAIRLRDKVLLILSEGA